MAGLVAGEDISANRGEQRVVDDLNEPDESGHGRGRQKVDEKKQHLVRD